MPHRARDQRGGIVVMHLPFRIERARHAAVLLLVERIHGRVHGTHAPPAAGIPHDTEKPGAPIAAGECPEVAKRAQRRLLQCVFRVVLVAQLPARQPRAAVRCGSTTSSKLCRDAGTNRHTCLLIEHSTTVV
jgi:hypothetical protein